MAICIAKRMCVGDILNADKLDSASVVLEACPNAVWSSSLGVRCGNGYYDTEMTVSPCYYRYERPHCSSSNGECCKVKLLSYIVAEHVADYSRKEVKEMEHSTIKDAKRILPDLVVAVDDVVKVTLCGYKKTAYIGRITEFTAGGIMLDCSRQYMEDTKRLNYADISTIEHFKEGHDADSNRRCL